MQGHITERLQANWGQTGARQVVCTGRELQQQAQHNNCGASLSGDSSTSSALPAAGQRTREGREVGAVVDVALRVDGGPQQRVQLVVLHVDGDVPAVQRYRLGTVQDQGGKRGRYAGQYRKWWQDIRGRDYAQQARHASPMWPPGFLARRRCTDRRRHQAGEATPARRAGGAPPTCRLGR